MSRGLYDPQATLDDVQDELVELRLLLKDATRLLLANLISVEGEEKARALLKRLERDEE